MSIQPQHSNGCSLDENYLGVTRDGSVHHIDCWIQKEGVFFWVNDIRNVDQKRIRYGALNEWTTEIWRKMFNWILLISALRECSRLVIRNWGRVMTYTRGLCSTSWYDLSPCLLVMMIRRALKGTFWFISGKSHVYLCIGLLRSIKSFFCFQIQVYVLVLLYII